MVKDTNNKLTKADQFLLWLRRTMALVFPSLSTKIESLPSVIPERMVEYPFIFRELRLTSGRVLDVGCTSPYNIIPIILADKGLEVHGIDGREFRIHHPNFKFHRGDIRKTGFPDSYFDCVIAVSTIEHIGLVGRYDSHLDLEGDKDAIQEIYRILKVGGNLILTVPFGKAKIVMPFHRIYDGKGLQKLTAGLTILKKEFYIKNNNGYWVKSEEGEAETIDGSLTQENPVACMNLLKSE